MKEMPSQQPVEEKASDHAGIGSIRNYAVLGLILVLLASALFMYRDIMQKNRQISSLQQENLQGDTEQQKVKAYIGEVTDTIAAVEAKLQEVRSRQVSITGMVPQSEKSDSKKARLLQDISVIEDQLKKDKKDVSDLQDKMRKSSVRIKALDDLVANLKKEIESNEKSMADLRTALEEKDRVIAEKDGVIKSKEDSLTYANNNLRQAEGDLEQTSKLLEETKNTAYYVVGGKEDLLQKNVLRETGRLMWKKLNISPDFEKAAFTKVHVTRDIEFPVDCRAKDVQLMPARSADTFTLEPAGDNVCVLKVTNPEQFWKMPYLVILKKG